MEGGVLIKKLILMLFITSTLLLSGCSPIELNSENLMKPPKLTPQQAEISEALERVLNGTEYNLKYPKSGEYRSAFVFFDIDKDGIDEAMVFYDVETDDNTLSENTTRINILDKGENGWRSIFEIQGLGTDVESVDFEKISSNEEKDIVIGWNTIEGDKKLCIYSFEDGRLKTIFPATSYTSFAVIDSNSDGLSELILLDRSEQKVSSAKMVKKKGEGISVVSNIALNGKVLDYSTIQFGLLPDSRKALFIDELISPNTLATEIVTIEDETMVNLMDEESGALFYATRRNSLINSTDINNDSYIEIPSSSLMLGYRESQEAEKLYQYTYSQFETGVFIPVLTTAINRENGYMIKYPANWSGNVTVKRQAETGEWIFVLFENSLGESTEELLKIRVYSQNDYKDNFELEKYRQIAKKGIFEYYAYIPTTTDSELSITYEALGEMFVLL